MKKRIVFVVYQLVCGGVESALFDLVRLMDKQKFDASVFCIYGGGEWEQKFIDAGINVLSSTSRISHHVNPLLRIQNSIRARQVNRALADGGKGLLKAATGQKYDIVVAYHIGSEFHEICFDAGVKTVKFIHGNVSSNKALREDLYKGYKQLNKFNKIICVSQSVQRELLAMLLLRNTCCCYNPIDIQMLDMKASQSPPVDLPEKYICAVGRLVPVKGFVRLISCFRKVLDAGEDIKLIIVGEGEERTDIEKAIRNFHLEQEVILTGYTSNPYPVIKNAQFMVCSSFSEGMPVTLVESLCLGKPVVSSYKPSEELFADLPCGITTEIDDDNLAKGIKEMLSPDRLSKAAEAARQWREHFSGAYMVEKMEHVFESI